MEKLRCRHFWRQQRRRFWWICPLACVLSLPGMAAELSLAPFTFEFPRDYFSHSGYATEWWYYTGNLTATSGKHFGFELTFFRSAGESAASQRNSVWNPAQFYLAHFAISDIGRNRFAHWERLNRAGPGLAGIDPAAKKIWNGNWSVQWVSFQPAHLKLKAVGDGGSIDLDLESAKPPAIHGHNGVSRKGPLPGQASHYYSLTDLHAHGTIEIDGRKRNVSGASWMDQEFFSPVPGGQQTITGWDWFSIRLHNSEQVMLYRLREKAADGRQTISSFSSGSWIDRDGNVQFLSQNSFLLTPGRTWHSDATGADYPVEWDLEIPGHRLRLHVKACMPNQEVTSKVTRSYWEGAVTYRNGTEDLGTGYLEMTGYTKAEQGGPGRKGQVAGEGIP